MTGTADISTSTSAPSLRLRLCYRADQAAGVSLLHEGNRFAPPSAVGDKVDNVAADRFVVGIAIQLLGSRVPRHDLIAGRNDHGCHRVVSDQRFEILFIFAHLLKIPLQRFFSPLALSNIDKGADCAARPALLIEQRPDVADFINDRAVVKDSALLQNH